MNTIADMGGMHGFGPVDPQAEGGPFHAEWEKRVLGVTFATLGAGLYNVDEIRRVTENIRPDRYLAMRYFERWLETTEILLVEKKTISQEELVAGHSAEAEAQTPVVTQEIADQILRFGGTSRMTDGPAARFQLGDMVLARNIHPDHHTRLARYVRGKTGTVEIDHGIFVLPDTNSRGAGPKPQHVYGVRFKARDLWGPDASPKDTVQIDLFDDYLEPA
jgi:nitrile hydratase subunit beta